MPRLALGLASAGFAVSHKVNPPATPTAPTMNATVEMFPNLRASSLALWLGTSGQVTEQDLAWSCLALDSRPNTLPTTMPAAPMPSAVHPSTRCVEPGAPCSELEPLSVAG